MIFNREPNDIDMATNAKAEDIKKIFEDEDINIIQNKYHKATFLVKMPQKETFDISTIKLKVTAAPASEDYWKKDALQRDFTINAMSMDLDGLIYDYCNGYRHLSNGELIFTDNADLAFKEDPIRIFRYLRYLAIIV